MTFSFQNRGKLIFVLSVVIIAIGLGLFLTKNQQPELVSPAARSASRGDPEYSRRIGDPEYSRRIGDPEYSRRTTPTPTPSLVTPPPTETPKPSPKPAGPCVDLPILMYHHIQAYDTARTGGYSSLTVTPEIFQKQLAYLNDRGYNSISVAALIAFFDTGTSLPKKPVMLTFDDGYDDFATYAAPLLSQYNIKASMFLPTGLVENPGYLKWSTVSSLANQGIYFGNHTWSHRSMGNNLEVDKKEITDAETQLKDHALNQSKVFVYPYGTISATAVGFLRDSGYALAFTTVHGRLQCKGARLTLPRIRIGNSSLSGYGL